MSENKNVVEIHGCIVCGRLYNLFVVYSPGGRLVDCTVRSPDGHRVMDAERPLVACNQHTTEQIEAALAKHYPGKKREEDEE